MQRGFLFVFFLAFALLRAAEPTGTISGRVLDASGASIAGAKVSITNLNTGFKRDTTTGVDGGFVVPLVPAGTYLVQVEASGFSRFEQRGVEVKTDETANVPVSLQVGSSTQSVTVE